MNLYHSALWFRAAVHRGTLLQVCFGPVLRFAVYPFYDDPVPWFTVGLSCKQSVSNCTIVFINILAAMLFFLLFLNF